MGPLQLAISGVVTIVVYSLLLFAVFKVFQIATELGEIKELLKDIKRNTEDNSPVALSTAKSPESLLRAVSAASYSTAEYPQPELPVGNAEKQV